VGDKNSELDVILNQLMRYPEGVAASRLLADTHLNIGHRTLLRRLDVLMTEGKVVRVSKGKNTLYKFIEDQKKVVSTITTKLVGLKLSTAAREIQSYVSLDLSQRKRVGYKALFLHHYQPNKTSYLVESERDYLKEIGNQQDGDQPAGTFAKKILDRFLIDLSWNSSRLEGNTYSLLETEELIHQGNAIQGKSPIETQMILNHKAAIEFLVEPTYELRFNSFTICNLHALLSDNLLADPSAHGRIRTLSVGIGGSVYQPLDVPQQLEENFRILLSKAEAITDPFEQSFFVFVQLPNLQPFIDVNKRVSRLSANIPFINYNYCPISFIDMPQKIYVEGLLGVYELNKIDLLKELFIWAYEQSTNRYMEIRQSIGEPNQFRMRYRELIYKLVQQVVVNNLTKLKAIETIRQYASLHITKKDQERFITVMESELSGLHEGNYARYKVTPKEFKNWKQGW